MLLNYELFWGAITLAFQHLSRSNQIITMLSALWKITNSLLQVKEEECRQLFKIAR
jgi:hypothetical protein